MNKPFKLIVENENDVNPSAIQVVDQDGLVLCKFSGPMSFAAAGAFIKYYHEKGLIAHAMDRYKNG